VPVSVALCYLVSAACAQWVAFTTRARARPVQQKRWSDLGQLLRNRRLLSLFGLCLLHWMACTPYHGSLAAHFSALGIPREWVGITLGLGVASEVLVLLYWRRFSSVISARATWLLVFGASGARWIAMSLFTWPWLQVTLSLLHGLTFGAFIAIAIASLAQEVDPRLRASGQALWASAVFGLGGVFGFFACGPLLEFFGSRVLFAVGAALEFIAMVLVFVTAVFSLEPKRN
jgi:MFS transporter, PPP family, 3-phenylpropionic acid transporter